MTPEREAEIREMLRLCDGPRADLEDAIGDLLAALDAARVERDEYRREWDVAVERLAPRTATIRDVQAFGLEQERARLAAEAERDAALAALAKLREVANSARANPRPERVAALDAALYDATADPSEHGARLLREAEERGARWEQHRVQRVLHGASVTWDTGWPSPAEVCRAARERGER